MDKIMWTSDHHTYMWAFPKQLPQRGTQLFWMSFYAVMCQFPFTGTKGPSPNMFQHENDPVHKLISMKTWLAMVGVKKLEWPAQVPDLHPTEHL